MTLETQRGIGAVLIAFATIGILLWLAATRLAPDVTLSSGGLGVAFLLLLLLGAGIALVRREKG